MACYKCKCYTQKPCQCSKSSAFLALHCSFWYGWCDNPDNLTVFTDLIHVIHVNVKFFRRQFKLTRRNTTRS